MNTFWQSGGKNVQFYWQGNFVHASLHYFLEKCPVYEKTLALVKKEKLFGIWILKLKKGFSRLLSWTSLYAKAFFCERINNSRTFSIIVFSSKILHIVSSNLKFLECWYYKTSNYFWNWVTEFHVLLNRLVSIVDQEVWFLG